MGYLFLFIALLACVTKGYCGKKTSGHTPDFHSAILANIIHMVLCVFIGLILVLLGHEGAHILPNGHMLLISALAGVSTAVFVVTWLLCVYRSAYMLLEIFLMLSVLIPLIGCNLFFDEAITIPQWIGVAVLFVAVAIMCSYSSGIKDKLTASSFILLLVCGISHGVFDFSQKLFVNQLPDGSVAIFNLYTYVFAAIVMLAALPIVRGKQVCTDQANIRRIFGYVLVMAICLFATSYCMTSAAGYLDAVILYPLMKGGSMILSSLMAALIFKEKLTAKAIIGMITAFAGLMVINLI